VIREKEMSAFQDWEAVWPTIRTFHPSVVPLPVRQGHAQLKNQVHPHKKGNVELMKVPNFLHLTPPVVAKQCRTLKQFCTPWPQGE
jgi:small subunit ribosomal protein S35